MKAFLTKAASVSVLTCGVALLPQTAHADVMGWNDLKDAVNAGQSISLGMDIDAAGNVPEWNGGKETLVGNNYKINGNNYNGFVVNNGSLSFSNLEGREFNRFLSNLSTGIDPDSDSEMYSVSVNDSVFKKNSLVFADGKGGGVIYNNGKLEVSNTEFESNSVVAARGDTAWSGMGGAIHNNGTAEIENSAFITNSAEKGGAIYNSGTLTVTGGKFEGNKASSGGAIYSAGNLILNSGSGLSFSGNTNELLGEYNDIYMDNADLSVKADGGDVTFEGGIYGQNYNINIDGSKENKVTIKRYGIVSANSVTLKSTTLELFNGILEPPSDMAPSMRIGDFTFENSPTLLLNVYISHPETGAPSSPYIEASGDVKGSANIVINPDTDQVLSPNQSLVFLKAPNDDLSTETSFKVSRVFLSPYMWNTKVEYGDGVGSTWYIYMTEELNNSGDGSRILTPEIVAYIGAQGIALEQHRNMVTSIRDKVASNKFPAQGKYGMYEDHYRNQTGLNMWFNPIYSYSSLSSPVDWTADIMGADIGFDIQGDISNKLGIFASYRYGDYDFSGKGEKFASPLGSNIEDNSFMAGLYYRYDHDNFWSFSTLYGGNHSMDISVDDNAVSESAKATQFGGSFEIGHTFVPSYNLTLEPSLGVFYTMIDVDGINDDYGKTAEYDTLHEFEGEAALKLEKTFDYGYGYGKIYLKPSILQTFAIGNSVTINGSKDVDTSEDQTLGRIEIGGRYAIDSKMSLYGYINYTGGSDYENMATGIGFNYRLQ